MDKLGINLGYIIIQVLGLTVLLLAMKGWAFDPILNVLEQRKSRIAKGLEDARQAAIARDNADAEAKKILDEARAEAATIRADASVQAEEAAAAIIGKSNEEAKAIVAASHADGEAERNRILSDLRGQVSSIAIAAANKLIGEALSEERQRQLIADFFAKVPADVQKLSGESAVITSALPLSDAEKANIEQTLQVSTVDYKVEPGILGGLVVRVGNQVVDGSVSGQLDGLREALK